MTDSMSPAVTCPKSELKRRSSGLIWIIGCPMAALSQSIPFIVFFLFLKKTLLADLKNAEAPLNRRSRLVLTLWLSLQADMPGSWLSSRLVPSPPVLQPSANCAYCDHSFQSILTSPYCEWCQSVPHIHVYVVNAGYVTQPRLQRKLIMLFEGMTRRKVHPALMNRHSPFACKEKEARNIQRTPPKFDFSPWFSASLATCSLTTFLISLVLTLRPQHPQLRRACPGESQQNWFLSLILKPASAEGHRINHARTS